MLCVTGTRVSSIDGELDTLVNAEVRCGPGGDVARSLLRKIDDQVPHVQGHMIYQAKSVGILCHSPRRRDEVIPIVL